MPMIPAGKATILRGQALQERDVQGWKVANFFQKKCCKISTDFDWSHAMEGTLGNFKCLLFWASLEGTSQGHLSYRCSQI